MTQILEKFLRKRKQAKNYPAKYQDVFDRNQPFLEHYIKNGVRANAYLAEPELKIAPWESFSDLCINIKYYEMLAEVEFVASNKINYSHLVQSLSYGYFLQLNLLSWSTTLPEPFWPGL